VRPLSLAHLPIKIKDRAWEQKTCVLQVSANSNLTIRSQKAIEILNLWSSSQIKGTTLKSLSIQDNILMKVCCPRVRLIATTQYHLTIDICWCLLKIITSSRIKNIKDQLSLTIKRLTSLISQMWCCPIHQQTRIEGLIESIQIICHRLNMIQMTHSATLAKEKAVQGKVIYFKRAVKDIIICKRQI
jgi:hypothetical protein